MKWMLCGMLMHLVYKLKKNTSTMSVNTADKLVNSDVSSIITNLKYLNQDTNQDLTIEFKGYTHSRKGFVLQMENIEEINDENIEIWKSISDKYSCEIDIDYINKTTNLYFNLIEKKACNMYWLMYLSFIIFFIWMLINRHYQSPTQNYTKAT